METTDDIKWFLDLLNENKGKLFNGKYEKFEFGEDEDGKLNVIDGDYYNDEGVYDFDSYPLDSIKLWTEILKAVFGEKYVVDTTKKDDLNYQILQNAIQHNAIKGGGVVNLNDVVWQYHLQQIVVLPEADRIKYLRSIIDTK